MQKNQKGPMILLGEGNLLCSMKIRHCKQQTGASRFATH